MKEQLSGPRVYAFKAESKDLASATSLVDWRARMVGDFVDGIASNRKSPGVRGLGEFSRAVLAVASALHAQSWRIGLIDLDNIYLIEREDGGVSVFLPDLGFAWVSEIELLKPNWLMDGPGDQALWSESRVTRQFAAPQDYQRAFAADDWGDLVRRDLRVIARLLRFALSGQVGGPEPARASKCPVWAVLRKVEAGEFADANAMSAALLRAFKAPEEPRSPVKPRATIGKAGWAAMLALGLASVGGSFWAWYHGAFDRVAWDNPSPPPRGNPPAPPLDPKSIPEAEKQVKNAKDSNALARATVALAKIDPKNPLVASARAEILSEINKFWAEAQGGIAMPLKSRELVDLYKQLTDAP